MNNMSFKENNAWIRQFSIVETKKHAKGFTIYKITSNVFPRHTPEAFTSVTVWKRYNEIHKLHQELKNRHKILGIKDNFPTMSRGTYFNRFDKDVVENRKKSILNFLTYVANNTLLFTLQCFVHFFETSQIPNINDSGNIAAIRCSLSLPKDDDILSIKSVNNEIETDSGGSNTSQSESSNILYGDIENAVETTSQTNLLYSLESKGRQGFCNGESSITCSDSIEAKTLTRERAESIQKCFHNIDNDSLNSSDCSYVMDLSCESSELVEQSNKNKIGGTDYIFEAAYHFSKAAQCEASKQYNVASDLYRAGIDCLQSGIEYDTDSDRRSLILLKANKYKQHEELIRSLSSDAESNNSLVEFKKLSRMHLKIGNLERPLEDMSHYHVLGVLDTVLLVSDLRTKHCYIIKTIYKNADCNKIVENIFPYEVPFMVPIVHFFQSETAIYLLLKQASGGKLWERIKTFISNSEKNCPNISNSIDVNSIIAEPNEVTDMDHKDSGFLDLVNEYKRNRQIENINMNKIENKESYVNDGCNNSEEEKENVVSNRLETKDVKTEVGNSSNDYKSIIIHENLKDIPQDLETENLLENANLLIKSVSETLNLVKQNLPTLKGSSSCQSLHEDTNISSTEINYITEYADTINKKIDILFENDCSRIHEMYDVLDISDCTKVNMLPQSLLAEWAAELLLAIEHLHNWGVHCGVILPDDLLLGERGQLLLSYRSSPRYKIPVNRFKSYNILIAPELQNPLAPYTETSDWWSYGAVLYHFITGIPLQKQHPYEFNAHTILQVPAHISDEANSLLVGLLQGDVSERLGCGPKGVDEIKNHPFFSKIDWHKLQKSFTYLKNAKM